MQTELIWQWGWCAVVGYVCAGEMRKGRENRSLRTGVGRIHSERIITTCIQWAICFLIMDFTHNTGIELVTDAFALFGLFTSVCLDKLNQYSTRDTYDENLLILINGFKIATRFF